MRRNNNFDNYGYYNGHNTSHNKRNITIFFVACTLVVIFTLSIVLMVFVNKRVEENYKNDPNYKTEFGTIVGLWKMTSLRQYYVDLINDTTSEVATGGGKNNNSSQSDALTDNTQEQNQDNLTDDQSEVWQPEKPSKPSKPARPSKPEQDTSNDVATQLEQDTQDTNENFVTEIDSMLQKQNRASKSTYEMAFGADNTINFLLNGAYANTNPLIKRYYKVINKSIYTRSSNKVYSDKLFDDIEETGADMIIIEMSDNTLRLQTAPPIKYYDDDGNEMECLGYQFNDMEFIRSNH